jgi:hypothetical protein
MNSIKLRRRQPKSTVKFNSINRNKKQEHAVRNIGTQKYWNEITQKEVCNKPNPLLESSIITVNDFEYYTLQEIKRDFGSYWEKVALFLTILYEECLSKGYSLSSIASVYWDYDKIRKVLGKDYLGIVEKLEYLNIISVDRKRSMLNPVRKQNYFQISYGFIEPEIPVLEKKMLINPIYEKVILNYFKGVKSQQSLLESYISETLLETGIEINNTEKISLISQLVYEKKTNEEEMLRNPFESYFEQLKVKKNIDDISHYKSYEKLLEITIDGINYKLNNKNEVSQYKHGVRKSKYGDRITHMCSNIPQGLRKFLTIQGESVTEIDIVASQPSFLLYLIEEWYERSHFGVSNNITYPESFLNDYNSNQLSSEGVDFYEKMIYNFSLRIGEHSFNRDQMKTLFMKLVFGNLEHEAIRGFNRKGLITYLFGADFYSFLESIKKIDVKGIEKVDCHKNLSAILQRHEAAFLEEVMDDLIQEKLRFLPLYDSLIIKKSDINIVKKSFNKIILKNNLQEFIRLK